MSGNAGVLTTESGFVPGGREGGREDKVRESSAKRKTVRISEYRREINGS